jgi:hypothetical protein
MGSVAPSGHGGSILRAGWVRWKAFAQRIGDVQARILLSVCYALVLLPFALAVRVFSDPLRLRATSLAGWLARPPGDSDPRRQAQRQF